MYNDQRHYYPWLVVPEKLYSYDPAWSICNTQGALPGLVRDPPRALFTATALTGPETTGLANQRPETPVSATPAAAIEPPAAPTTSSPSSTVLDATAGGTWVRGSMPVSQTGSSTWDNRAFQFDIRDKARPLLPLGLPVEAFVAGSSMIAQSSEAVSNLPADDQTSIDSEWDPTETFEGGTKKKRGPWKVKGMAMLPNNLLIM